MSSLWIAGAVEAELCSISHPWFVASRRIMHVPQPFDYSKGLSVAELLWQTISYGVRSVHGQRAIRLGLVLGRPVDDAGHGIGPAAPLWLRVFCLLRFGRALRYLQPPCVYRLHGLARCSCRSRGSLAGPADSDPYRRAVRAADLYTEQRAGAPGHGQRYWFGCRRLFGHSLAPSFRAIERVYGGSGGI